MARSDRPELGGFRLDEPIAQGGESVVWRARHGRVPAAVKILRAFGTEEESLRFRDEVQAVARLSHPGIVSVLDHGHAPQGLRSYGIRAGAPWLAMELVGGGTLTADRVRDWSDFTTVAAALLDGLAHAHARGVIHRDLKPPNVLCVSPDDVRAGVRLTDLGIAWTRPDADERGASGTLAYMAPEQIEIQPRRYGPWTDLYGLGCLLWEVLTGAPPFDDLPGRPLAIAHLVMPPPRLVTRFDVPARLDTWLRRLLAKEPQDRFGSAAEAADALASVGGPIPDRSAGTSTWVMPAAVQGAGLRLFGLRDVPMVGRERERRALWDALERVRGSAAPEVVVVRGPAGAGRSRLLRWLQERLAETGAALPILVRPVGDDPEEVVSTVLAELGAAGLEGDELVEHLSWRLGADLDPPVRAELVDLLAPPPERQPSAGERHRVVRRWLSQWRRGRPLAFLVDDAERARDASELARRLVEPDADGLLPVLVVVAVADQPRHAEPDDALEALLATATELRLDPPSADDRLVLLRRHLAVDPRLAARLDEESGGNPLVAIEILRDHVERGWLRAGPDGLRLQPGRDVVVPPDRLAPWTNRLQRAVPDAEGWTVLEVAAALGEEVAAADWQAVCESVGRSADRKRVQAALTEARLVEPSATGFRFAHPMVRLAIERHARLSGRYKDAHRACLAWARTRGADAERVARHLRALEAWDEAASPLLEAADARHGREGPGSAWEGLRLVEEALTRAEAPKSDPRWSRLRLQRAKILQERARYDEALALLDEVRTAIRRRDPAGLSVQLRHVRAVVLDELGRQDEAIALHVENVEAMRGRAEHDYPLSLTLDSLSTSTLRLGRLEEASRWAAEAEQVLARLGHGGRQGMNLIRQASIASMQGDVDRALALLDRAEPLVLKHGALTHRAFLFNDRGDVLMKAGRWAEAEPLFARATELWRAAGYRAVTAALNLALCRLHQRRVDEAEAMVMQSGALDREPGSMDGTAAALIVAVCHAQRGAWDRFDAALDRAEIGLAHLAELDFVQLLAAAARAAEAAGEPGRAGRCDVLARRQEERIARTEVAPAQSG